MRVFEVLELRPDRAYRERESPGSPAAHTSGPTFPTFVFGDDAVNKGVTNPAGLAQGSSEDGVPGGASGDAARATKRSTARANGPGVDRSRLSGLLSSDPQGNGHLDFRSGHLHHVDAHFHRGEWIAAVDSVGFAWVPEGLSCDLTF